MNLRNHFQDKKHNKLSEQEKFFVYQKILDKQYVASTPKFRYFSWKLVSYSVMSAFLVVLIYGVYFVNDGDINKLYDGLLVKQSDTNIVQADYIAQVIEFKGDFYIEKDNKKIKTSNIGHNDTVVLSSDTEILFNIDQDTQAKIVGPAEFSLEQIGSGEDKSYKMYLQEGDFIHIQSIDNQESNMEILLEDEGIQIDAKSKKVNFQLTKENDIYKINNQGKSLLVVRQNKDTGEKQEMALESNKLLAFNEEVSLQDSKSFADAVINKELSQTFTFNDVEEEEKDTTITEAGPSELEELIEDKEFDNVTNEFNEADKIIEDALISESEDDLDEDYDKILWQITSNKDVNLDQEDKELVEDLGLSSDKAIISKDQDSVLNTVLNRGFIKNDIEKIGDYYIDGNQDFFDDSLSRLSTKISNIYSAFGLQYKTLVGSNDQRLSILKQNVDNLYSELSNNYYIPDLSLNLLKGLSRRISEIN